MNIKILRHYAPLTLVGFFIYFSHYYYLEIVDGGNKWKTGDWLIHWYAGPVRRGLIGTLFLYVSDYGIRLKWLVYVTQELFYLFLFYAILRIYYARERSLRWWLFLFCPAFLLFPFYDLQGGYRKEIMVLSAFAVLCLAYARAQLQPRDTIIAWVLFVLAGFSHEPAVLTLPFFLYIYYKSFHAGFIGMVHARSAAIAFSLIAFLAGLYACIYPGGDPGLPGTLCQALIARGFTERICTGAIAWLDKDVGYYMFTVGNELSKYMRIYPLLFALSIAPVFFTTWRKKEMLLLMAAGFVCMLPLFIVALDWGRWIEMYTFLLFASLLAQSVHEKIEVYNIHPVVILLYLTTWSVPLCYSSSIGKGLFETIALYYDFADMLRAGNY